MDTVAAATPPGVAALRGRSVGAAFGFFVQGLVFISLTTRLPKVQAKWHLSPVEL